MWMGIKPLSRQSLTDFEKTFKFNINPVFREYLLDHNGGIPTPGTFVTAVKERKIDRLLDFSDRYSPAGAWAVNHRLRDEIGEKRIIIGTDSMGNFICLERDYKKQRFVLWNHLTGNYEENIMDISAVLRVIG